MLSQKLLFCNLILIIKILSFLGIKENPENVFNQRIPFLKYFFKWKPKKKL